jgi:Tol biopolymer transport system component
VRSIMVSVRSGLLVVTCLIFSTDALAQYGYHFGRNKVQYEAFDWHILRTDHFDIYYYPEMRTLAEKGARFAEEAYEELQVQFATSLTHRVPLIFYSSNLHFRQTNVTPGMIPDGVGGFFEFMKGRVVVPAHGDLHRFRRVIRHELIHVFTFDRIGSVLQDHRVPRDRFMPLWFTEGLAEYWSGERDHQHEMVLRDAVVNNYALSLSDMHRISGSYLMYKLGEAAMHFIAETYGEEALLRLMDNIWVDRDFRRVMEHTFAQSFDVIDERWLTWLRARYFPDFERLDVPPNMSRPVVAAGFAAKPVYYRSADGQRRIFYVGNRTGYTNLYSLRVDSTMAPIGASEVLIRGERSDEFESMPAFESRLSVSENGRLAFVTRSGGQEVIHLLDLESEIDPQRLRFDELISISSPDWRPGGERLVFSAIDRSGYRNLFTAAADGKGLQRLTDDHFDTRDPAWSPDGSSIVFSSDRTRYGRTGAYNLFVLDLESADIKYLTQGESVDLSPRFTPDGASILYTSSKRDSLGKYSGQDIWKLSLGEPPDSLTTTRLTRLSTAAFDPIIADDDRVLFSTYHHGRFSIRAMELPGPGPGVGQVVASRSEEQDAPGWEYLPIEVEDIQESTQYRRRYRLDLAQGAVSQTPVWGTTTGAILAFSDMMGDHHYFVSLYNSSYGGGNFLQNLNMSIARFDLHRRANIGYGAFRYGGLRYDITDPDAVAAYPLLRESILGGFTTVAYPLSQFRRIEASTSVSWNEKQIAFREFERSAFLASTSLSFVHDHTLFGMNGPMDGVRANLTLGYTRDVAYRNVDYLTVSADARKYFRLGPDVTFASWGLFRANHGREARLWYLGGSWDLRGWRFFDVRGQKMWFTSHELRIPLVAAPSLFLPILSPFGVANLRGALFVDAAHAWNSDYHFRESQLNTGETLGSVGLGLRVNLFGGLVLRYDIGHRYRDGFRTHDRSFRQFFFGFDF